MEEKEHRFTATVLDKPKGKVTPSDKVPEGANCLLTENELVIETDPPIRIPVARIRDCQVIYEHLAAPDYVLASKQPTAQPLGTLRLKYVDELDQKHRLSLKMAEGDAGLINATLRDTIRKAQAQNRFEALRKKTPRRIDFIAYLQLIGSFVFLIATLWGYSGSAPVTFLLIFAFAALSFTAGLTLLKRKKIGYILTTINQLLQLVAFNIAGVSGGYTAIGRIYIYIQHTVQSRAQIGFSASFKPGFHFHSFLESEGFFLGIDLIAAFILSVLYTQKRIDSGQF